MSIAGELVTERFKYDGGRQVTVYVPPDPPRQSCSPVTASSYRNGEESSRRPPYRPR